MSARTVAPEAPKTREFTRWVSISTNYLTTVNRSFRLIEGSYVVVLVETTVFELPRNLVEHYSQHLKKIFQSKFTRLSRQGQEANNDVGKILSISNPFDGL